MAYSSEALNTYVAKTIGVNEEELKSLRIIRRSIDARGRNIKINLNIDVYINEQAPSISDNFVQYKDVSKSKPVHIIGAGPAGLFAALRCIELGLKPIIIERGKNVQERRRDLAAINREHIVNPDSNYCFGEGGAGTYSDGKLYTRSTKRGDVEKILRVLVQHGANEDILVEAHPHIGTNKLPKIITTIRETIIKCGGEVLFNTKLIDFKVDSDYKIKSIICKNTISAEQSEFEVSSVIMATGHSARDIFNLLFEKKVFIEPKIFAMGVRVEHPQALIDSIQYHCSNDEQLNEIREILPAASYSLVQQVNNKGVYSFCMCPGGIIAPCATDKEEVVTNGWSPSKRNNPYANSGIVTTIDKDDYKKFADKGIMASLLYQQELEKIAFEAGGKSQTAPAQRLTDFLNKKTSNNLPDCSYQPGLKSVPLHNVLPQNISGRLAEGFKSFGQKMRGYLTNEAVIVGVESRTSSPIRITRNSATLQHIQITNLFPCGEGAGYAGGIVSAAIDGEKCAEAVTKMYNVKCRM